MKMQFTSYLNATHLASLQFYQERRASAPGGSIGIEACLPYLGQELGVPLPLDISNGRR